MNVVTEQSVKINQKCPNCSHQWEVEDRIASLRRTPTNLFLDMQKFFDSLHISEIKSIAQSESNGHITITVSYRG